MEPLPLRVTGQDSLDLVVTVLRGMNRCTLVTITADYVHAEFRSAVFRFVDDVEFLLDREEERIHFRSVSRTGYYDFGVNRKRMQEISAGYLNTPGAPAVKN